MDVIDLFHVVLTRFNVQLGGINSRAPDEQWLRKRVEVFERVCLPSIASQTSPPDLWLLFFHHESPAWLVHAIAKWESSCNFLRPVFCGSVDLGLVRQMVRSYRPGSCDWLLTTRIDNDDGIRTDLFFELRRKLAERREFLNPVHGLIAHNGKLYRKRDYSSPFISLMEPWEGFETVWKWPHHLIRKRGGGVKQIGLKDAWVQMIHEDNLANRVRGVRVSGRSIDASAYSFDVVEQGSGETLADLLIDNSLGLVKRYTLSGERWLKVKIWGHCNSKTRK